MTERKYSAEELSEMGKKAYEEFAARVKADPLYPEVVFEQNLWLQLVEARMYGAGLSQEEVAKRLHTTKSQVARLEKNPLLYRLETLRRYVKALGEGFKLEVKVINESSSVPNN